MIHLKVFTPTTTEVDQPATKVSIEATDGALTLLPRHVDFATTLVEGLLAFVSPEGEETFVAVDGGTLVKCGDEVRVSTPRAVVGNELGQMERLVRETFVKVQRRRTQSRTAAARLQADLTRRLLELGEQ